MGRVLVVLLLLSFSLIAVAQTTAPPATSDSIPARVNLDPAPAVVPAASTPMYVVAPPTPGDTSVAVPAYSVATPLVPSGPPASIVRPAETAATSETATVGSGTVTYTSEVSTPSGPSISVADAAAQYRASKPNIKSRVIDQSTLSMINRNPSGLVTANEMTMPQGDITWEEASVRRNAKPEFAAAGDVLDPRDLAAVEAAVRRTELQPDVAATRTGDAASAQYEQLSQEAEAEVQPADAQPDIVPRTQAVSQGSETVPSDERAHQRDRLPESSSPLPFVALLGFIAVAGGAASLLRSR